MRGYPIQQYSDQSSCVTMSRENYVTILPIHGTIYGTSTISCKCVLINYNMHVVYYMIIMYITYVYIIIIYTHTHTHTHTYIFTDEILVTDNFGGYEV